MKNDHISWLSFTRLHDGTVIFLLANFAIFVSLNYVGKQIINIIDKTDFDTHTHTEHFFPKMYVNILIKLPINLTIRWNILE